jgi:hypothetical protein
MHAGTVLWPTSPAQLTDRTICPACLTPLTDVVCQSCGLNLAHPAAGEVASLSQAASDALTQRVEVIGRIRYETSQAAASATAAHVVDRPEPAAELATPSASAEPNATTTALLEPPMPPPGPPTVDAHLGAPEHTAPRRSGVQVALLVAGVSLLSVFAIYFLVYAFINYGIIWRSVIIAAITIAAFTSASLLRRKALVASAEGIAVFALVLVYLDAYALRANDFFGLGTVDGSVYWGTTITLASVGFIAWHRLSRVRAASIVGWPGIAIGVGTLAWGLGDGVESVTRIFIAVTATAVAGIAHTLVPRPRFGGSLERMLVLAIAAAAMVAAFLVSWAVEPSGDWGGTIAGAIVALAAFTHAVAASLDPRATPTTRVFAHAFATIGGIAAASAASALAIRVATDDTGLATFVPAVAATLVTLALEAAARRGRGSRLDRPAVFAAWGSAAVLALTVLIPLIGAATPVARAIATSIEHPWSSAATVNLAAADPTSDLAVLALACVVALAAAFWLLAGTLRQHGAALAWGVGVVLVLATAQLPYAWLTLAAWLILAAAAFALLRRAAASPLPLAYRACLWSVLATSAVLLFVIGWASLDTWVATTVATIVLLVATRTLTRTDWARAALLGAAAALLLVGVAAATRHITWEQELPWAVDGVNASVAVTLVATVLLALAAFGNRWGISTLDRRTAFWIAGPAAGVSALITLNAITSGAPHTGLLLPQPITSLVSSMLLFGALALWVGLPANSSLRPERIAASVAAAPTVLWVVDSFARVLGLPEFAQSVVPITAALLAAAGALALSLLRPSGLPRWAREAGVALVAVPAVGTAVAEAGPSGWLVLILAAVTLLLVSVSTDGLFASRSPRRHLGWAALALATAGLWWRLSSDRVEALEPYVLPLAGALLVIAFFIHRAATIQQRNQRVDAPAQGNAAPLITLSGLLVAVLPLAADAITGDPPRAIIMFGVSGMLALLGSFLVRPAVQGHLDAVALAGAIGVLVTASGRAFLAPRHDLVADGWLTALLVVLLAAAIGQARARQEPNTRWRLVASQVLAVVAIGVPSLLQLEGFSDTGLGFVRVIATIALMCALHVIAFSIGSAPFTRHLALAAILLAIAAVAVAFARDVIHPVELGTVPIAIALLVTGRIRLLSEPAIRSWRTLAPGLAFLLAPTLLATNVEPELWRLVGLGVVAVAVLIVGAVRKLQAPFILGLAVVLIHGFATFAPQIRAVYESQEWWVWGGLAGIVLVLLAIRYEKRIQNLKSAIVRITALR